MKKYTITAGYTFRADDGAILGGGDVIELSDDVAAQHIHKLAPAPEEPPPAVPAKRSPKGTGSDAVAAQTEQAGMPTEA